MLGITHVLLCVTCFHLQVHAQDTTLSAHVRVQGKVQNTGQKDTAQNSAGSESSHAENVVVWLSPLDSQGSERPMPSGTPRLTQHNKTFEPHVLVVPVGAVVEFPNRDPFFHNVFSLFDGKRFDLGLYEAGTTRNVSFDRPGVSYIFCNIHAEMSAAVVALDTPYFGISDRRGEIVIQHVPFRRYTMHVWYETALPATLKAMTREINVTANSSTLGVLQIPETPTHAHKNKYGMDYEPPPANGSGYDHP